MVMRKLKKPSHCKSPTTPSRIAGKQVAESRRTKEVRKKRRSRSSQAQMGAMRATLRRMSGEVAEQRARLVQMKGEAAEAEAAAEEMAIEVARMRRQNRAIMLLHYIICSVEQVSEEDNHVGHNPRVDQTENSRRK